MRRQQYSLTGSSQGHLVGWSGRLAFGFWPAGWLKDLRERKGQETGHDGEGEKG